MSKHPSFEEIEGYAEHNLVVTTRKDVAEHLSDCASCRRTLVEIRSIGDAARALRTPELPPRGFETVRRRIESGDRVLLRDPRRQNRRSIGPVTLRRSLSAAAAALALLLGWSAVRTPRLDAFHSDLSLTPDAPVSGDLVRVAYSPGQALRADGPLVLRARMRAPGSPAYDVRGLQGVVATLAEGDDGTYRGGFRIPSGVVYVALAVEDASGEAIDDNGGRLWELLVHDPASGDPLYDALDAQVTDSYGRSWTLGHEVASRTVALYPDRVPGWLNHGLFREQLTPAGGLSAMKRELHVEFDRLHSHYARLDSVDPETAADLWYFAWRLSETGLSTDGDNPDQAGSPMAYWRDRVRAERGTGPRSMLLRSLYAALENHGDPEAGLEELESLWRELDGARHRGAAQILRHAATFTRNGDPDVRRRWLLRRLEVDPHDGASVGRALMGVDGGPETAIGLLEKAAADLVVPDDTSRPLGVSRSAYADSLRLARASILIDLARGYSSAGRMDDARSLLAEAGDAPWQPELLLSLADLHLALGDTARAVDAFARVGADPLRTEAFSDTIAARVPDPASFGWSTLVERYRENVNRAVLERVAVRPYRSGALPLRQAAGTSFDLGDFEGSVGILSFWSAACGWSLRELPELQRFQQEVRQRGLYHLAISAPLSDTELPRVLADWNAPALEATFDMDGTVAAKLNAWGTPQHLVIDELGRPVFAIKGAGTFEDVLRVAEVLSGAP